MEHCCIDSRSLVDQVAERIEQLIIDEELTSGMKLPNETELSNLLTVGRSTVREAVKVLVSKHILEIRRGSGTYVAQEIGSIPDPLGLRFVSDQKHLADDIKELFLTFGPYIASFAANNATSSQIEHLEEIGHQLDVTSSENHSSYALEQRFYHELILSTNNRFLIKLIPCIPSAIQMSLTHSLTKHSTSSVSTYGCIVSAIKEHDANGALNAMQSHLNNMII